MDSKINQYIRSHNGVIRCLHLYAHGASISTTAAHADWRLHYFGISDTMSVELLELKWFFQDGTNNS